MIGMARGGDPELENAYYRGYEDAMREIQGSRYGERGGYSGDGRGGYGMREPWKEDDDDNYDYGERRGVKGTGPYSRYPRRY